MNASRKLIRQTLIIILVGSLLCNILFLSGIRTFASSQPNSLTLKWRRNLGIYTHLAPLAADLNGDGKLDIVITGEWANDTSSAPLGTVLALDGVTGNVLWRYDDVQIGTHSPFDIVDLNRDGVPEIVVSAWYTLVLHGNDGSLYWTNQKAIAFQNYNAIADVDGDGYPEIFVSSGSGPTAGAAYITELSYDGRILRQAYDWHPCFGGLTIGDTNHDGRFELYQGDRGIYSNEADPFVGGGMGLRALDALTLQSLWNDPTVALSSSAPILADVDKDGILDVIVADQANNGTAVYNSRDGSVLTTGGKYRKGWTDMPAHSQPTVADIDNDGNLEFIDTRERNGVMFPVKIWDLYDWKLDAVLPVNTTEPPKVADVTGDGKMDIIAVRDNPNNSEIFVYSYNNLTGNYDQVDYAPGLKWGANDFTLVQDVDGDGYNELVVTSMSGDVYCYDTPAPTPYPRMRSELQFYSENKAGVAEYVPPPTPVRPVIVQEQPQDGSLNQPFNQALLADCISYQQHKMNVTFGTNASGVWESLGSYSDVTNGQHNVTSTGFDRPGTTYYWSVNATDVETKQSSYQIFSFTTRSTLPTNGNPNLVSNGDGNGSLTCYNQNTTDIDADKVTSIYNWYVNGTSLTNLNLPFDTRTAGNPLLLDSLLKDGFEDGLSNWVSEGWEIDSTESHSGTHSVRATNAGTANSLSSQSLDTSSAEGFTVSFWYRYHGVSDDESVYLQFWNGSAFRNIFKLENTTEADTWHSYSIQTYDPRYRIQDFKLRFFASGLRSGETIWIDDFSLSVPENAKDYSGYNNHATIHGATWTSKGIVGGAYTFDGVNDFLRIPDDPSLGGDGTWSKISLEFWVKPASLLRGATIFAKKVANQTIGSYIVGFSSNNSLPANTLYWGIYNGTDWLELSDGTTTVLDAGSWHHVVLTYESGLGLAIYINGTLRASRPASGNIARSPGASIYGAPLFIGHGMERDRDSWLNGSLDEVRIYPRTLTPPQVLQRFLETKDGLSKSSTIVGQETNKGDDWKCKVVPNDSFSDGEPVMATVAKPNYWLYAIGLIGFMGFVSGVLGVRRIRKKQ